MRDSTHDFLLEEPKPVRDTRGPSRLIGLSILGALALVLTLIGVDVAVIQADVRPAPRPIITRKIVKLSGTAAIANTVYLSVSPGIKPGSDGQLHDAFSVTNFTVRAGQPVKLIINNTDTVPHSITSAPANVNIVAKPGTHTYTLLVRGKGVFQWHCSYPCDPYSMDHMGYMEGTITSI